MLLQKTCIIITGPTAVGKTSFAIQLAQQLNTQIISADSRQCFKELNIGVAKPSAAELQAVQHYFIGTHSIQNDINAVLFEQYALQKAAEIFKHHEVAVIVGGTGLYIKAFCEGIDEVPAVDITIRENIVAAYKSNGLQWLQNEVQQNDPVYFANGEIQNPQRLMRALEVKLSGGKSIVDFQTKKKKQRNFNLVKIGLELPKEALHKNINTRIDNMMEQGLLKEVQELQVFKKLNALHTVGYRELFEYLEGNITLQQAIEQIKINTRQYAKRQLTWFKKDLEIKWVPAHLPAATILEGIL
jgi:tRNA dimethylallyltransferase